jgi:hypothetical protein
LARLVNIFKYEIEVPSWKYCNDQKDSGGKGSFNCKFVSGSKGEKYCNLFNTGLYSYGDWIKKCNNCIDLSK